MTQDRCQIEGLDDTVATIYNTSLLVREKSGTSVDVKVDVKNVKEGRRGGPDVLASRSQTKPEILPKIGAKSKASTIWSQPYITHPYLLRKKSGTSVDVKVDVKNVTERREGEGTRLSFLLGYLPGVPY